MRPAGMLLAALVTVGVFAASSVTGGGPPQAGIAPSPALAVEDPAHRFRVTVPEGWYVRTEDLAVDLRLEYPNSNSGITIWSEPWCSEGTLDQADRALAANLDDFRSNTGFAIFEPTTSRFINGHAAAHAVFTHFLASGRAYQVLAVVLGPEWSTGWVYSGLVHDESEIGLWPDINATLDTFDVLPGPQPVRLAHSASHFALAVPSAWDARQDVAVGDDVADAVLTDLRTGSSFVVVSERRAVKSAPEEAQRILQEAIDAFATLPGFRMLEPVTERIVDGRPAADVFLTWQPSTYNVNTAITVIVGGEWGMFWALSGTTFSWMSPGARTCFNATVETFDIEEAPAGTTFLPFLTSHSSWFLAAGLAATAVEGAILGYLIVRGRRRRP